MSGLTYFIDADKEKRGVSTSNPMPVSSSNIVSAFGDLIVAEEDALVQIKYSYGISASTMKTDINDAAGSVTTSDSLAVCSTGAVANSQAALFSRIPAEYQPGIGISCKRTASFSTPKTGSVQSVGIGTASDGYFFAYHDTVFGIDVEAGGAQETVEFEITAAATGTDNITITLDGDAQTVAITSGDTVFDIARKIKAAGSNFALLGDGWRLFIAGDTVEFESFTADSKTGAFTYGAGTTGSAATVTTILEGVAPTLTTIAQANWNKDKLDGTGLSGMILDHTKLNVYKIQFQFLGSGVIRYFVESDSTGEFILVHQIDYANNNTVPSVRNPTLPSRMMVKNTTNNTDIVMKTGSDSIFSEGKISKKGILGSTSATQTITTEEIIFAAHMPPVFKNVQNRVIVRPVRVTLVADGTKLVTLRLYINPVINGAPIFTPVNAAISPVLVSSTSDLTVTGTPTTTSALGKTEAVTRDIDILQLIAIAGDSFVITAESANSSEVSASVVWQEFQ